MRDTLSRVSIRVLPGRSPDSSPAFENVESTVRLDTGVEPSTVMGAARDRVERRRLRGTPRSRHPEVRSGDLTTSRIFNGRFTHRSEQFDKGLSDFAREARVLLSAEPFDGRAENAAPERMAQ
ncbi:hypothetical protein [Herbidospora cretacea]|uniref:hypothetical protein n=1 Tax=Herbidospora cretacea TaxID=28444 RepID=UPI0012FC29E3|nr:hypothetical protein [Herbidospora cretacea]